MAAPIVIKSTDAGAPVCNGVVGQAIVLLDYVLITQLGWTKVFSGTNKAVYYPQQKGTENRLYYRVDDNHGQSYKLSVYETMTDVDTGVLVRDYMWVTKSQTADTTVRPWIAIGDAFGVYFRSEYYPNHWKLNYMGLCNSFFSTDMWFSVITGYYSTGSVIVGGGGYSFYAGGTDHRIAWRSGNGVLEVTKPYFWAILGVNYPGANYPGEGFPSEYNYPWNNSVVCSPPILVDSGVRGSFPGFYAPHHSGGFVDLQEIPADGKTYLVLFDGVASAYKILIDVGGGFRP